MMPKYINVSDFSKFPGPRYRDLGEHSGEQFREEVLAPAIKEHGADIIINLDGVMGYGSSFLEESFGGLIRCGIQAETVLEIVKHLQSEDDPSLIVEITEYVKDEITGR